MGYNAVLNPLKSILALKTSALYRAEFRVEFRNIVL